ncbi:MAG: hypothetical protein ACOCRO_04450 [Halanaerobiales bacterium]
MSKSIEGILYYGFPLSCDDYLELTYKDVKKMGVDVGFAGTFYSSPTCYYVYITESRKISVWGKMIKVDHLELRPLGLMEWDYKLKKFCEINNIEMQNPAWYLTSLEG